MFKPDREDNFFGLVYRVVSTVPAGCVATYGQVAAALDRPRSAQVVGWALKALPKSTSVPWWRIVNKSRRLSIVNPKYGPIEQADLLRHEGLVIDSRPDGYYVQGTDWHQFPAP